MTASSNDARALSRLIRSRMAELGLTYDDVAKRAKSRGHSLAKSTLHHLAKNDELRQTPRTKTLQAIAAGLDMSTDVLYEAAAEAAGYKLTPILTPLESAHTLRVIVAAHGDLDAEQQAELARMAEHYAAQMRKMRERAKASNGD